MPESGITLQNRITTLMVASSLFFIGVFTFIQVNNQLSSVNRYNTYRSSLSAAIVKNNIEIILKEAKNSQLDPSAGIQENLSRLKESSVINEAVIYNKEGRIIASTDAGLSGLEAPIRDIGKFEVLENLPKEKWLDAQVDKAKHKIIIYLGLKADENALPDYAAKLTFSLANIQEAFAEVYVPVAIAIAIVIMANILFGFILSSKILGPIKVLNKVTKLIAGGDLNIRTDISTKDELQELGETFNYMTEELVKMKERAENANPLTKLPGNIIIHEQIENRITNNRKFTVIYCDLDNFKAFNDKYGIAKGDDAIKLTAEVFKEAAKTKGNPDDFIGHEGGDDFILLTSPDRAQAVADHITSEFDKRVRSLYSREDLEKGHIVAHARDGSIKQFPIMTISLAGVSNETRPINSYAEVTNIAAEIKKKAKAIEGSVFVTDQRKSGAV